MKFTDKTLFISAIIIFIVNLIVTLCFYINIRNYSGIRGPQGIPGPRGTSS